MRDELEDIEDAIDDAMTNEHSGVLVNAERRGRREITSEERMWRGRLAEAFYSGKVSDTPDGTAYKVKNTADYAAAQNDGFRPSSPPPVEALLPWVEKHMYAFDESDPRRVAHGLAKHISRYGVPGIYFREMMKRYLHTEAESDLQEKVDNRL